MWRSRSYRGVLLIWANLSICLLLALGGAALFGLRAAAFYLQKAEEETEMALLLQETMETVKYNRRFGKNLALPGVSERNGREYKVDVSRETLTVEGIPLEVAAVTVESSSGESVTLRAAVGRREAGEEENE